MAETDLRTIADRHDLPVDAVETLLVALQRGGGGQAQFSHPALGGMGQWSRGGGLMIGDMFDRDLKAKVARVFDDLAEHVAERSGGAEHADSWWPHGLGQPSSAGSQNARAYAFFPEARRLAIRDHDGVRLYDTEDHRITGVSQQQADGSGAPSFRSQHGEVRLDALSLAGAAVPPADAPKTRGSASPEPQARDAPGQRGAHDVLATIERLHELHRKGALTDAEFADKKKELLARL